MTFTACKFIIKNIKLQSTRSSSKSENNIRKIYKAQVGVSALNVHLCMLSGISSISAAGKWRVPPPSG